MTNDPERHSTMFASAGPFAILLLLCIAFLAILASPVQAIDLGMSPSTLIQDDLLPGSSFQATTTLSRISTDGDLVLRLAATGPAADWLVLPETLVIPDGQRTATLPFTVHVPFEAALGTTPATITITTTPDSAEGLSTALALPFTLALTVTDREVRRTQVTVATVTPFDRSYIVAYTVTNTGNVPAGPLTLAIVVKDRHRQETLIEETVVITALAPPFAKTSFTLRRTHDLPKGAYWVTLTFLNGTTASSFPLILDVPAPSPEGSLETEQALVATVPPPAGSPGRQTVLFAFLAVLLLVGVVAGLISRQHRRSLHPPHQDRPQQEPGG